MKFKNNSATCWLEILLTPTSEKQQQIEMKLILFFGNREHYTQYFQKHRKKY